ncbi:MAG: hypothetical protein ACK56F_27855, partial [bacterium]
MIRMTSRPVEFSREKYENEEQFAAKWRKTVAGVKLNNNTDSAKTGTQSTTGTKNMRTVLK